VTEQAEMLVDTDAGVDDILALFILLQNARPSAIDVAAAFGNVSLEQAISNVSLLSFISGLGPRKILRGSSRPLDGEPHFATDVHGADGLGGLTSLPQWRPPPVQPREDLFRDTRPDRYRKIIVLGPMTDMARLGDASPIMPPLFVMGGAFGVRGNITPFAEFNFHADPGAASQVFEHPAGDIFIVPLDVCNRVVLERGYLSGLCDANPGRTTTFLNLIHQHYMDFYRRAEGIDGCHPHDALAVAAALQPDMLTWTRGRASVTPDGSEAGRSIFHADPTGRHHLARSVDEARFFGMLERAVTGFTEAGVPEGGASG
jgi:purine nucleosidase